MTRSLSASTIGRPRILLAEDDPDAAFFLKNALIKVTPNWGIHWVENGVCAVDYVMDHGLPNILITDLQMPHMDGFELIAWVRSQPRAQQPSIIVISGSLDAQCIERCRCLGADDFIPKQTCLHEFETHIRKLLQEAGLHGAESSSFRHEESACRSS